VPSTAGRRSKGRAISMDRAGAVALVTAICAPVLLLIIGFAVGPRAARALARDRRGAVAILFAVSGTALIGMAGLATEAGLWYLKKTQAQAAADTAAYAGAVRLASAQGNLQLGLPAARAQATSAATDTASQNGITAGSSNSVRTTVTVNIPPAATSAYAADSRAVQVVLQQSVPRLISALFLSGSQTITVSSTVTQVARTPSVCVLGLSGGVNVSGSGTLDATGCSVASDAAGPGSISIGGSGAISAEALISVGGCSGCSGSTVPYKEYQPAVADPFQSLQTIRYPSSCPSTAVSPPTTSGSVSNPTGTVYWCSDLKLASSTTIDLRPGTYILYDAGVKLTGQSSITCSSCSPGGSGVTIVLTGRSPGKVGSWDIAGGATVSLNAPSSGPYAGVVLYRDVIAADTDNNLTGGGALKLNGGIYFPSSTVNLNGSSGLNTATACTVIVAKQVSVSGNASTLASQAACSANGTSLAVPRTPMLVE
jgi:Flp pilus assembly protein TadG